MQGREMNQAQFLNELAELRQRVAELEGLDAERKRTEEALRESEGRFRLLFNSISDAVFVHGLTEAGLPGVFVEANDAACKRLGYTREELLHMGPLNIDAPEGAALVPDAMQRLRADGQALWEGIHVSKEGRNIPVEINNVIFDFRGTRMILATVRDITERKRAERVQAAIYRISEAAHAAPSLDQLYASIHTIIGGLMPARNFYIALYDAATDLVSFPYYSDEFDLRPPPQPSGSGLTGYVLRTGRPLLATPAIYAQLVSSSQVDQIGTPPVDWLGVPLRLGAQQGETIGVMAVQTYTESARLDARDQDVLVFVSTQAAMTIERKQAEAALREQQSLLMATVENLPFEFWACGPDGRYVMQNTRDIRRWGNLVGKSLDEIELSEGGLALWKTYHQRAFAGEFIASEHQATVQGERVDYFSVVCPIRDGEAIRGILGIKIDITDRKRAEEEIKRLNSDLEQRAADLAFALDRQRELDRLQREFIQNVSHELRTPLALIRGHAEVLESGWVGDLQPQQLESIGVIVRRAQMLSKLVDDIVAILGVERRKLNLEPVDLALLVRTSVDDFETAAGKTGLTVGAELASGPVVVSGDVMALRRVLDNLVGNALKFTPPGGRVTVRLSARQDMAVLKVADTGIGVPADKITHIFERFYQVDGSATRRYGGVGLGLALVKEIVEAHGGQITVESQVGQGTTFTAVFPLQR